MASKLEARDLDTLCSLKRRQETPDEMGGGTIEFVEVAQLWANIRPMRGGERFFAQQITPDSGYVIGIRNRSDLREADVIDTPLGRYDVKFIRQDRRAAFIELECSLDPPTEAAS